MTALGVVFLPDLPPERLREMAEAADEAGLAELWLWEDCFKESGIATAAAALAWTRRVRVCIGLLPVPLRNVALTAMEVATLHRLFPGRVTVAVGHGVQDWMAQVGARVDSPLTLLREYATALRALLRGETVTAAERYLRLDAVTLDWPPTGPAPVYAGASGPRTLRLSGEVSDGTVLTAGTSLDGIRRAREFIDAGRARAGRTEPHSVVASLFTAIGPDAEARLEADRVRWEFDTMRGIGASGDAKQIAEAVRAMVEAGADTVVLQPTPDDPDPVGLIRFAAREVQPLVA